jgi:hypothetical protein
VKISEAIERARAFEFCKYLFLQDLAACGRIFLQIDLRRQA